MYIMPKPSVPYTKKKVATSSQEYKNPKKKTVQHQEGYKKCITINVTYRRVREFAGELELKSKAEHLVFSNA